MKKGLSFRKSLAEASEAVYFEGALWDSNP